MAVEIQNMVMAEAGLISEQNLVVMTGVKISLVAFYQQAGEEERTPTLVILQLVVVDGVVLRGLAISLMDVMGVRRLAMEETVEV
jgi:hypothetical protein